VIIRTSAGTWPSPASYSTKGAFHRSERKVVAAQTADSLPHRLARVGQRGDVVCGQISGNPLSHAGIEAQDAVCDAAEDRPADARVGLQDTQHDHGPDRLPGEVHSSAVVEDVPR
jgi:hypothetical protein